MRLLIVRQDKLGDCLLTLPIAPAIKKRLPDTQIHVACQAPFLPFFERQKSITSAEPTTYRLGIPGILRTALSWSRQKFDAAILPKEDSGDHTFAARLAGIPTRIGMTGKGYGKLLTKNFHASFEPSFHEVRLMLRMAEEALGVSLEEIPADLPLSSDDISLAQAMTEGLGGYFILAPFTGGTSQPWGVENFRLLGERLSEATGLTGLVVGTAAEEEEAERAASFDGGLNAAGQFSLTSLAALMKESAFLVSVNSGLIHLAATQQTPAVVIETRPDADTASLRWAPWMSPYLTVLPFADEPPSVNQVEGAVLRLAGRTGGQDGA